MHPSGEPPNEFGGLNWPGTRPMLNSLDKGVVVASDMNKQTSTSDKRDQPAAFDGGGYRRAEPREPRGGHDFRLSGRVGHPLAPGPDPVPRPDSRDPAAARAGRRVRRPGLRPLDRQDRRLHGHQRTGGHESGHRHRRRQARQRADAGHHRPGGHAGDRHRRLSGDADRRGLPQRHQAPLPGDRRQRHRPGHARGVPRGHHRPAGPGAGRYSEERAEHAGRAGLRRAACNCRAIAGDATSRHGRRRSPRWRR